MVSVGYFVLKRINQVLERGWGGSLHSENGVMWIYGECWILYNCLTTFYLKCLHYSPPHNFEVTFWPSVAPQDYFHEAQPANSVASVYRVIPEQYAGSAKWHCVTVCQHCSLSAWPTHLLAEVAIHKLRLPMFYATPGIYSVHHPFVPFSHSFLQAVCFVHNWETVHNCLCVVSQKVQSSRAAFCTRGDNAVISIIDI